MQGTQARSIRKMTAKLLALCMVISFFPWMTAAAAEGDAVLGDSGNTVTEQEGDPVQDGGAVTMSAPVSLPAPGELEQLSTPENLVFGYDEQHVWYDFDYFGVLSFDSIDAPEDCECNYRVNVYRDGTWLDGGNYPDYVMSIRLSDVFNESGEYMFEVIANDPGGRYSDSDPALLYYTYKKPETSLAAPENLRWIEEDDKVYLTFDAVEGAELYEVVSYLNGAPRGHSWYLDRLQQDAIHLMSLQYISSGTCTFKVRALSSDIETIANGEFSELSPEYTLNNGAVSKLATPTGLQWSAERPGDMYWDRVDWADGGYNRVIYKDGEVFIPEGIYGWDDGSKVVDTRSFDIFESGSYTFKVQAMGADPSSNSDWSEMSPAFVYVRRGQRLTYR